MTVIKAWGPGGSFMVHKMGITSHIPVFQGLRPSFL